MSLIAPALIALPLVVLALLWREHTRTYYELEKRVENRLGPVRGELDGLGQFAYTSSGLIPQLNNIAEKYGGDLIDEEVALMQRSRACYYIGGALVIFVFLTVPFWMTR